MATRQPLPPAIPFSLRVFAFFFSSGTFPLSEAPLPVGARRQSRHPALPPGREFTAAQPYDPFPPCPVAHPVGEPIAPSPCVLGQFFFFFRSLFCRTDLGLLPVNVPFLFLPTLLYPQSVYHSARGSPGRTSNFCGPSRSSSLCLVESWLTVPIFLFFFVEESFFFLLPLFFFF